MAKNAPVKKSKRGLKRGVRRSLAAVLMITAIGVAAIPVPENRASAPGEMSRIAADVHTVEYSYPSNTEDGVGGDVIQQKYWLKDAMTTQGSGNKSLLSPESAQTYKSLVLRLPSDGKWELIWQFEYYNEDTVVGNGVISKYNNEFQQDTVELQYDIIYKYDTVTEDQYRDYYTQNGATEYTLKNPSSNDATSTKAKQFLNEYFPEAYQQHLSDYQNYLTSAPELGVAEPELKRTVNNLSDTQKLKYYCDNNKGGRLTTSTGEVTPNDGDSLYGYELVEVTDRSEGSVAGPASKTIYIPRKLEDAADVAGHTDTNGFKYLGTATIAAIGDKAFANVGNVSVLEVPSEIRYIGESAFENSFIKSISFVNVEKIGNRAFKNCTQLSEVSMGDGTRIIGTEAFYNTGITSVTFPYSVNKIGPGAFAACKNLTTVDFSKVTADLAIYDYAFYDDGAITSVNFKQNANTTINCNTIGYGAFAVGTVAGALTDFEFPSSINSVAEYIETTTTGLDEKEYDNYKKYGSPKDDDDITPMASGLGDLVLAGRISLQHVVLPANLGRSFSAVLPNNLLYNCSNLAYLVFPDDGSGSCGELTYNYKVFFATISNADFYVRGPKVDRHRATAAPRAATWKAQTGVPAEVPYVYTENGKDYYEVSDGTYLMCIDNQGMLTSCTFAPDGDKDWDGEVVIPSKVGNTKVVGIAPGCFSDSDMNEEVKSLVIEDDSITSIGDGVFQGGGGVNGKDWQQLKEVYIGNSVASIGSSAFKDCTSLVDVTFATPTAGYSAFKIGTDAFKTESPQLTFHGDIVEGYAPFDWATSPDNVINAQDGLRVCYQSLAPTLLTVMYNPVTEMVTLLDYPKYSEIDTILNAEYAEEIEAAGAANYNEWREYNLYIQYSAKTYDVNRYEFAQKWKEAEDKETLYADDTYGPWITPVFCALVGSDYFDTWYNAFGTEAPKEWDHNIEDSGYWTASAGAAGTLDSITDFFFEPITAYAADQPTAYYEKNPFVVTQAVDSDNPFFPTTLEEDNLVYYTKNIVVPAGVDSIDVYGYAHNLTADGEKNVTAANNTANLTTYLKNFSNDTGWTLNSQEMYDGHLKHDEDDDIDIVSGLFSGYYVDGDAAGAEKRQRGNDVICTVDLQSVKYLPDYAFDSCESLWSVNLGPDCADIGVAPFRGCYSMRTVGDNEYYTTVNGIIYSVNTDGSYTIEECLSGRGNLNVVGQPTVNNLSDSNLDNVSAIKPGAFEDCDSITSVDFGKQTTAGLTVIPEDCFKNCDNLQTVVLPLSANNVLPGAFVGANRLSGLTVYGKEVEISDRAFDGDPDKVWTVVRAYEDSAVERYVGKNGEQYKLQLDSQPLGELWQVSFYDANYVLIEDLKDQTGEPLDNPQYVEDGARPTEPEPPTMEGWTFERWVGANNVNLGDAIHEDTAFYAQGYSESGMVNGKYPVEFWDGVDGKQVGPTQYVDPGSDAIAPAHPVHEGYTADGYSDTYTNVQTPKTILMKYKPTTTGSGGSTQNSSGNSTNNTSSSSSSTSTTSTSTSSTSGTPAGLYVVTVIGGSGSGTYAQGATVQITANTPAAGQTFSKWVTESQGVTLASVSTTPTTFTMPANNVTITAEYTAAAAAGGTGNTNGTNAISGTGTANRVGDTGNTRVDITKPGISNKNLATANVNGSTDNFVVKITETDEATRAVADALTNKYGNLESILYYAMDISLYDATGTVKITDTSGLSVDLTLPLPDALVAYGGNNMAGAVVNGSQLENLNESFTTIDGVPCIRFMATHFSPYTIYVDTGNLTESMLDTTPKTGDPIHPKWFLSIGLACLSVILFLKKDKGVKAKTA